MRNGSIVHIWWKVGGSFRDSVFGRPFWPPASLSRSTVRPQVIQQGNLLQGWTIICINPRRLAGHVIPLWPACRWLISENPTHFAVEVEESDSRRETRHIPIPPVSGSWKFGSRPLSRNLETFSMFLCCTCSINFFRFA